MSTDKKWVDVSIQLDRERDLTTNPRPTIVKGYVNPAQAQFSSSSFIYLGSRGNRDDVVSNVAFLVLRMDLYCSGERPFSSCGGMEMDHYTILCHPTLARKEETRMGEDDAYVSLGEYLG